MDESEVTGGATDEKDPLVPTDGVERPRKRLARPWRVLLLVFALILFRFGFNSLFGLIRAPYVEEGARKFADGLATQIASKPETNIFNGTSFSEFRKLASDAGIQDLIRAFKVDPLKASHGTTIEMLRFADVVYGTTYVARTVTTLDLQTEPARIVLTMVRPWWQWRVIGIRFDTGLDVQAPLPAFSPFHP